MKPDLWLFICLSILISPARILAKSTWINVVGIHEHYTPLNYFSFYSENKDFLKFCKENPSRDCVNYINPDVNLMHLTKSDAQVVKSFGIEFNKFFGLTSSQGPADKTKVFESLKKAIENANENDEIIFSLKNHGGPNEEGKSPSCITLNSKEEICENELKEFLAQNPRKPGVKLLVVADGCYSGGFVSLSSKNTCVVTTAPQKAVGYAGTARIWDLLKEQKITKLSQLTQTSAGNAFAIRTASQIGLFQQCESVRRFLTEQQFDFSNSKKLLDARNNLNLFCKAGSSPDTMNIALSAIHQIRDIMEQFDKTGLEKASCAAGNPDLCSKIKSFIHSGDAFTNIKNLTSLEAKAKEIQKNYDQKILAAFRTVKEKEIFITPETPAFNSLNPERQKAVLKRKKLEDAALEELETKMTPVHDQIEGILNDPGPSRVIAEMWPCFTSTEREAEYWNQVADKYPDILLSNSEIEDAKKCESEFSF
jgi:hypothetical protein